MIGYLDTIGGVSVRDVDPRELARRKGEVLRSSMDARGWGYRYLPRFKVIGGRKFQLHATRGWKCVGRVGQ